MTKVFVSHASEDLDFISEFVDTILLKTGLREKDIFVSSLAGMDARPGVDLLSEIRKKVSDATLVHGGTTSRRRRRCVRYVAMPTDPESAVRLYLLWLDDPTKLIDQAAVKKAEAAVQAAKDPLDKLQALADLEHAKQADTDQLAQDFIAHARGYATANNIPVSAFQEMKVPNDLLRQAGFDLPGRGGRTARARPSSSSSTRAPRVSLDIIKAATLSLPKQFTLNDVGEKAGGGSQATIRKAVEELVSDGKAKKLGPKENYTGRGRAPTVYELQ